MTRNLRVLVVALVAILATSVFAASAAADEFRSEGDQTVVMTGKQSIKNVFKTTAGTFECGTASYSATVATPTASVTFTPSFASCICFGGFECTADVNGCTYKMNIAATTGTMALVCPAGNELTLTALGGAKCTVHIKPQTLSTVTYKNLGVSGPTRELELVLELKNIHYTHTEGFGIGKCTTGTGNDGTLNGTIVVTGRPTRQCRLTSASSSSSGSFSRAGPRNGARPARHAVPVRG